ncbi:murein biosynthesis integral membrane protein MurJ [Methylocystis bryophila]|uniref:Probable lipid II flippase MurJ n=1 Tax=Methylocystis bryophila TaxID=655015 RepID=A0A1W6MSK5_9HYPH|nr:murein biosynthesis integral membrane protein MurJ [Methylocystis bryophila]ARN80578.1 murein biosynthesis integral membrane protein MurJ [Methylocystis bryophila]BDV40629.1 putative lipid II flippase MurJ [Methylocystis bryophila]
MIRNLVSVGGFTLLSRVTGFLSQMVQAAVLGATEISDAFIIAQRLPSSFRSIFGEGAFNTAYVPCYSEALEHEGAESAKEFASQVFSLLLASQALILILAWIFTPQLVAVMAPGLSDRPEKFAITVMLTRIAFPYLACMVLFTLHQGTLNAHGYFALPAFAPSLMNIGVMLGLGIGLFFLNSAVAATLGFVLSGFAQLGLLMWSAHRHGLLERIAPVRWRRVREFLLRLGPAVIGSASGQIAIFVDTILASMLPDGVVSSIQYADRLYQLPNGLIGVAAGTVLLPEMSRRLAAGDEAGAKRAQNATMALTIMAAFPFFVAFISLPEVIVAGIYMHGKFGVAATYASADVLAAYGGGLPALVLVASAKASFQARGDTRTPMLIALAALAVNIALKVALIHPMGAPGLAIATAIGLWINLGALIGIAMSRGIMRFDALFAKSLLATGAASASLIIAAQLCRGPALDLGRAFGPLANLVALIALSILGGLVYFGVLIGLLRLLGVRLSALRGADPGMR